MKNSFSPRMRNHPSPRHNRSLPSNLGDTTELRLLHPPNPTGEAVAPMPPELRRVDQYGNVELEVRGPEGSRLDGESCP